MASKYMARDDAPFGEQIWAKIDEIVTGAAKAQLSGRRLLDIEGLFGLDLKSVPLNDEPVADGAVKMLSSKALPIPLLQAEFTLSARDLATFEQTGFSLEPESIATAAMAVAAQEDALIFDGHKDLGIAGLMSAKGAQSVKLGNWDEVGTAAADVIKAVNLLDAAGFHGPYLLGLNPGLYNLLFRLYPQGYQVEMQHVESIVGGKVIKAPGIKKGGVLLASGSQFASIIVGQDMTTGFIGPDGADFRFKIVESLAPRIRVPSSVCVLQG